MPTKNQYISVDLNTPISKLQEGGTVSEVWEQKTGLPWAEAKSLGLTDGSMEANLALKTQIDSGNFQLSEQAKQKQQSTNTYTVKKGDNLSAISQSLGVGMNEILSLNPSLKNNPDQINVGQNILLPKNASKDRETRKDWRWYEWDDIKSDARTFNKLSQVDKIVQFRNDNPTGKNYAVVDKANGLLHIYQEGQKEPIYSSPIDLGAIESDAQTVTKVKDGRVDWSKGNKSTGAGRYYISNFNPTGYKGMPSFNLMNERQYEKYKKEGIREQVSTSFHAGFIPDDQTRVSNGCIRCNRPTLNALSENMQDLSEVYILPEDEGNSFDYKDGKLVLSSQDPDQYLSYTDMGGNNQQGQGINRTTHTINYHPIKLEVDENEFYKYAGIEAQGQASTETLGGKQLQVANSFLNALEDNKRRVIKATNIPEGVYNDLTKVAFGILGTESNYGDESSIVTNLGKTANRFVQQTAFGNKGYGTGDVFFEQELRNTINDVGNFFTPTPTTNPWSGTVIGEFTDTEDSSVGLTQIRWNSLDEEEKEVLNKLDITSPEDFLDPEKAAVGTISILANRYNSRREGTNNNPEKRPPSVDTRFGEEGSFVRSIHESISSPEVIDEYANMDESERTKAYYGDYSGVRKGNMEQDYMYELASSWSPTREGYAERVIENSTPLKVFQKQKGFSEDTKTKMASTVSALLPPANKFSQPLEQKYQDGGFVGRDRTNTHKNRNLGWVQRGLNSNLKLINHNNTAEATHQLAFDKYKNKYVVYPTVVERKKGHLEKLHPADAYNYARENDSFMYFDDEKEALDYSINGLINHKKYGDGGTVDIDLDKLKSGLIKSEHGGFLKKEGYNPYTSMNADGAMGKYQFLESVWGNEIKKFAEDNGYRYESSKDFLNNSALQEDFFEHYIKDELLPQAKRIKKEYGTDEYMDDYQLVSLLHFTGYPKTKNIIANKDFNSPQSYNTTANDYLDVAGFGRVGSPVRKERNQAGVVVPAPVRAEAEIQKSRNQPNVIVLNNQQPVEEDNDPLGLKNSILSNLFGEYNQNPYQVQKEEQRPNLYNTYLTQQLQNLNQL